MLREPYRIRALHLHAGQRLRHVLADELLPVRPRRRIRPQDVVAAVGVVELDEGGAAVARMELHAVIGRVVDDVGGAHAKRVGVTPAFVGIVAAEDRHVAAAPAALLDEAAGRGAVLERRDHLQQDRVDREQRVLQAVFRNIAVAIADGEAHDLRDIRNHGGEVRRDQADLPQTHIGRHGHAPLKVGLRFSTNAFAASL